MAITKAKKLEILERLKGIFDTSAAVAFVQFHKLGVAGAQELRRKLREAGSGYFVAKKTLIRKSLEGNKISGEAPELQGETAIAYLEIGHDVTAPAREIFGMGAKLEQAVTLVGGIFEGRFIGKEEVLSLATIPPRQTLYAQFANLLNSPLQRLVMGLSEVAKKKI